MPLSTRSEAYADVRAKLDQAAERGGLKLRFHTTKDAKAWRFRAYGLRKALRLESKKLFQPWEDGHDRSAYDGLLIKVIGAEVLILPSGQDILETTDLQGDQL